MPNEDREPKDVSEEIVAAGAVVNVTEYLKGLSFPAKREDVERKAQENGADDSALDEIRKLPEGRAFRDPAELIKAIGDEVRGL